LQNLEEALVYGTFVETVAISTNEPGVSDLVVAFLGQQNSFFNFSLNSLDIMMYTQIFNRYEVTTNILQNQNAVSLMIHGVLSGRKAL